MPRSRKRNEEQTEAERDSTEAGAPQTKRKRVSLACDACRAAREKCDGLQPQCSPCTSQSRNCSYTPASKKRGVQTGYLRTIELSLAWVLDQVPESERALHAFLTDRNSTAAQLLCGKTEASSRLHKSWTKGNIHRKIGALLAADETSQLADGSPSGNEDAAPVLKPRNADGFDHSSSRYMDTTPSEPVLSYFATQNRYEQSTSFHALRLPRNWRHLLDTHFSNTHEWLPIVQREELERIAGSYTPEGWLNEPLQRHGHPNHALLWAVLALASFQIDNTTDDIQPRQLFKKAREMMPSEGGSFHKQHVAALLLHGLVHWGQDTPMAACLVVGTACRIALQLHQTGHLASDHTQKQSHAYPPDVALLAACSALDSWASLCLGQPSALGRKLNEVLHGKLSWDPSRPSQGGSRPGSSTDGFFATMPEPLAALCQLNRFGILATEGVRETSSATFSRKTGAAITAEDLIKSLDGRFSYCNSVVHGDSTPLKPAAFLLQLAFLTATIALANPCRPSLLSTAFEVAESCTGHFGVSGTSPFVIALLEVVRGRCATSKTSDAEKHKWDELIFSLRQNWNRDRATPFDTANFPTAEPDLPDAGGTSLLDPHAGAGRISMRHFASSAAQNTPSYEIGREVFSYTQVPNQTSIGKPMGTSGQFGNLGGTQGIDFDAIMDELGSIEGNDMGMEADPQFMTNLGFAPDYDLGEMFQGYFAS